MLVLPIYNQTTSKFKYSIILDGAAYVLNFYFNTRDSNWYMDIADAQNNTIRAGFKLVVGYWLLSQWRAYPVPPGNFIVYNMAASIPANADLGLLNLGQQYQLLYLTQAECAAGAISGVQ